MKQPMKKVYLTPALQQIETDIDTSLLAISIKNTEMEGFTETVEVGGETTHADARRRQSLWDDMDDLNDE